MMKPRVDSALSSTALMSPAASDAVAHLSTKELQAVIIEAANKKEEKPKPKPSGVRPRQLLLPTLMVCVMALPILVVILPVFMSARKQATGGTSVVDLCVLEPYDKYFTFNATSGKDEPVAGTPDYIPYTNAQCSYIQNVLRGGNADDRISPDISSNLTTAFVYADAQVLAVDPLIGTATIRWSIGFGGQNLSDSRGRLNVTTKDPAGKPMVLSFTFLTADGNDVQFKTGDKATVKSPLFSMSSLSPIFLYPFDKYNVSIGLDVSLASNNSDLSYGDALLPFLSSFNPALTNFKLTVVQSNDINNNLMINGDTYLAYNIIVERTGFVKFFAIIILMGMWVIVTFALTYGIDMCYLRPRNPTLGDAGLYTGLLFAMNNIRNVMPNAPPIGVGVDMFGFIWLMLFLMILSGLMMSRVVMVYVHPEPTLYDKVFKTVALKEWQEEEAKKAQKKADAAALEMLKEEEKKNKAAS